MIRPCALAVLLFLVAAGCRAPEPGTAGTPRGASSVDLLLWEPSGVTRRQWPVTQGVPFPAGLVGPDAGFALFDGGREIPVQARVTSRWPDGSARWVLADFQTDIPSAARKSVTLRFGPGVRQAAAAAPGIAVTEKDGAIRVDAGRLAAEFRPGGRLPFDTLSCDGRPALRADGDLLTLRAGGKAYAARGDTVRVAVESRNALRVVVRGDATFAAPDGSRSLDVTTRVYFYHSLPWLRLYHTIVNRTGADVRIEELSVRVPVETPAGTDSTQAAFVVGEGLTEALYRAKDGSVGLRTRTEPAAGTAKDVKDRAFKAEHGAAAAQYEGATERQARGAFFLASGPGAVPEEELPGPNMLTLTTGAAALSAGGLNVSLHCRDFWRQSPKEIRVDGRDVTLHLYPDWEPPLDFWRGTAKTHEMILRVEPGAPLGPENKEGVRSLKRFLIACEEPLAPAVATPHWIENSHAFGPLFRFQPDRFPWLEFCFRQIHENAELHPANFPGSTMLDYGDFYTGGRGGQWTNNEEDVGFALLLEGVRTGYPRIFWMAEPRIHHMIDVDTHHEAAEPYWAGGQRYHSTQHGTLKPPSPDHEWLEGPLYYYCLTGYERAREVAEARADHYVAMAKRGEFNAKGLGRTQGWPLIALACAYRHLGHERYREAADRILDGIEKWIAEDGDMVYKQYEVVDELGSGTLGQGIAALGLMRWHEATGSGRARALFVKVMDEAVKKLFSPEGFPLKNSSLRRNYYAPGEEAMTFLEPLHYYARLAGRPECAAMARRILKSSFIQTQAAAGKATPLVYRFLLPYLGRADADGGVEDVPPR